MASVKYYPSAEELTTVTNLLYCTESGCSSIFKSESNLNLHLAKSHKKEELANLLTKQEQNREYYCPESNCVYNSSKYFKSFKLLKQHYLKVHTNKDFLCGICSKGFPTEVARNSHMEYCGINFKCCECEATYSSYDTLTTHGRRKKHKILPKINYKPSGSSSMVYMVANTNRKEPLLLPRPSSSSDLLLLIKMSDKSSQTDLGQPKPKNRRIKSWKETQTSKNRYPISCAETQTIGDYIRKKSNLDLSSSSSTDSLEKKSIKTQTAAVTSTTKSCNTSFNMNELNLAEGDVGKMSLGTQTLAMLSNLLETTTKPDSSLSTNDLSFEFMNSSCQTSFTENLEFDSNNFFNCHMETQTDFILNTDFDLLEPDFYSNMCTQTNEVLSSEMEFNNIHTQTVMDDILKSVGSQTMMSVNSNALGMCRDMAHNETQTEVAFKQMLEEINA